jgi:hypothetical protein
MIEEYSRLFYCQPDEVLEGELRRAYPNITDREIKEELAGAAIIRQNDFLSPEQRPLIGDGLLMIARGGANLEASLCIANLIGAFPYTDTRRKWKELQALSGEFSETARVWSPLTKAFQGLNFTFLDDVDTAFACEIRSEDRLAGFRAFLRDIWVALTSKPETAYDRETVRTFNDRLQFEYQKASEEWKRINLDWVSYVKSFSLGQVSSLIGAMATSGAKPFVEGTLSVSVPAAGLAIGSILELLKARFARHNYRQTIPMSIFVDLSKRRRNAQSFRWPES